MDQALMGLLDYMEDHGYDPIGASDIRYDVAQWLRTHDEEWVSVRTAEGLYVEFLGSDVYRRYFSS